MTKQQLNDQLAQGIQLLRTKYDGKKLMWRIEKWTHGEKWSSYGSGASYLSEGAAQSTIHMICEKLPNNYKSLN